MPGTQPTKPATANKAAPPHLDADLFSQAGLALPAQEDRADHRPALDETSKRTFKSISEAAEMLSVPQHVLRFWESKFPQIKPTKLRGGRRYYRPQDIETLIMIKDLLYTQGYTIKGAKKAFAKEKKAKRARQQEQGQKQEIIPLHKPLNENKKEALTAIKAELFDLQKQLQTLT